MDVVVVLEYRFDRTPDGAVWAQTGFSHRFWQRYLDAFDGVRVVARVRDVRRVPDDWARSDGAGVTFAAVPHYLGPAQYLLHAGAVGRAARAAVRDGDAVILRVPSTIAGTVAPLLYRTGRPYAVEVVGDPFEVFAPGAVRHPLRPLLRWWFPRQMRTQCARAAAAAYVTRTTLQRRYPCPGYSAGISDVELPGAAFAPSPRPARPAGGAAVTLLTVGSLAQLYKGPDVLIDATADCVRGGLDVRTVLVGDGRYRAELEARARDRGLQDRVTFLGQVPAGDAVRAVLDSADLFVLPSRTEGLPRALVEAMARAMPCVGSDVGGIPELLPPQDLVPPGDAAALAARLREFVADPARMASASARNLEAAREYREEVLNERRRAFYRAVRDLTERRAGRAPAGGAGDVPDVAAAGAGAARE
jgi:glycosyltransferase involved in cell wall biosynthesis